MYTLKFLTTLLIPTLANKIVQLKTTHTYTSLEQYFNLGDNHFLFIEDDFNLDSINEEYIDDILEDELVNIIAPNIKDAGNIYNDLICGENYSWGLDRINQRELPLDCEVGKNLGSNEVTVYVLDTGIEVSHPWLPNAIWGANYADYNDNDEVGHGTHVAGIIGGKHVGVSQNVNIVSVKVLGDDGSGSTSGIMVAMKWVLTDVKQKGTKGIINMSLGGGKVQAFNNLINELFDEGIITVVAAGNEDTDACNTSPASAEHAITVGATTSIDKEASFSNDGDCVNIFAPGYGIFSSYKGGSSATLSGTSMASPFVAGVVAHIWSNNIHLTAVEIVELLYDEATMNTLGDVDNNSINRFVYLTDKTVIPWKFILITAAVCLVLLTCCSFYFYFCYKTFCYKKQNNNDIEIILDDIQDEEIIGTEGV